MNHERLSVVIFGAHPDDPDWNAGGLTALYSRLGHTVRLVSLTNGDAGHAIMGGGALARRRRAEAEAAGACLGAEYIVLDNHDGVLQPTLEVREQVIRVLRESVPDLVMCHRPYDYHPDHRYAGQVVQDAVTIATIANLLPGSPPLGKLPVLMYTWDDLRRPYPFQPDVVVGIDDVVEQKIDALHCHVSQFYEPGSAGRTPSERPPESAADRRAWLRRRFEPILSEAALLYRERLVDLYGPEKGNRFRYAEAFEVCGYGMPWSEGHLRRLFPFVG